MNTQDTIAQYVDTHHAEQIEFLRQIVRVPSDTPPGNNNPPAERAAELLTAKGYAVERFAVPDERALQELLHRSPQSHFCLPLPNVTAQEYAFPLRSLLLPLALFRLVNRH